VVACKDEFVGNPYPPYNYPQPDTGQHWIRLITIEEGTYPYVKVYPIISLCMHCDKAPCMDACKIPDCIYRTGDGAVIIDPLKCNGCRDCIEACPYEAIFFNDDKNICQKCTLCMHRIEQGKKPACIDACPTEALYFGEEQEILPEIIKKGAKCLYPEYGTEPRIYHSALPSPSLAGHIIYNKSLMDVTDADIKITNMETGSCSACKSDVSGNFLATELNKDNAYTVEINCQGYVTETISNIRIDIDYKHLGNIKLSEG